MSSAGTNARESGCGAAMYLPPYSPDLNPIELLFHPLNEPMPVASDAERPLPNAWRDVPRRPKG
jgi:hypothetical protein